MLGWARGRRGETPPLSVPTKKFAESSSPDSHPNLPKLGQNWNGIFSWCFQWVWVISWNHIRQKCIRIFAVALVFDDRLFFGYFLVHFDRVFFAKLELHLLSAKTVHFFAGISPQQLGISPQQLEKCCQRASNIRTKSKKFSFFRNFEILDLMGCESGPALEGLEGSKFSPSLKTR